MLKWILVSSLVFGFAGMYLAHANYRPLSNQIDVKTMQAKKVDFIVSKRTECIGSCINYSNSSYGSSSFGGK